MDWKTVSAELRKKLDPKHVVKPSGNFGPKGDYIEGWHAIAEANEIFGFGGWSYTIDLHQNDVREVEKNGKTQWQAAYTCVCTVTVDDVTRQDVGFGSGFANNIGDAIEGATKEAATDGLKRCLRTFGNRFGLALYDKTRASVGVDVPAKLTDPAKTKEAVIAALMKREDPGEIRQAWQGKTIQSVLPLLPDDMRKEVTALYEQRAGITPMPEGMAAE